MGGINHKPCGQYLEVSTTISRLMTAAYAAFLEANVFLEDVILSELSGGRGNFTSLLKKITDSRNLLLGCRSGFQALRAKMQEYQYSDLPSLQTVNLQSLGEDLSSSGAVDLRAWNKFAELTRVGGFNAALSELETKNESLVQHTENLLACMQNLSRHTTTGMVNVVLEENRQDNIRLVFAVLFSTWAEYTQEFLASSLISTELWYAHKGFGSLSDVSVTIQKFA